MPFRNIRRARRSTICHCVDQIREIEDPDRSQEQSQQKRGFNAWPLFFTYYPMAKGFVMAFQNYTCQIFLIHRVYLCDISREGFIHLRSRCMMIRIGVFQHDLIHCKRAFCKKGIILKCSIMDRNRWIILRKQWCGLDNFKALFSRSPGNMFFITIGNTVKWVGISLFFQFTIGFGLALLLKKKFKGSGAYQGCIFFPWAVSGFLIGIIWRWLYNG